MTDESGQTFPLTVDTLLDKRARPGRLLRRASPRTCTPTSRITGLHTIVDVGKARGVPVVSSRQILDWLDGRNGSTFKGLRFEAGQLRFTIETAPGARGLQAMVPSRSAGGRLLALTRDGTPVSTSSRNVKGIDYEVFDARAGEYVATYPHTPPPSGAVGGSPATDTPATPSVQQRRDTSRRPRLEAGRAQTGSQVPVEQAALPHHRATQGRPQDDHAQDRDGEGPEDGEGEAAAAEADAAKLVRRGTLSMTAVIRVSGRSETDYPGALGAAGAVRLADSGRRSGSA